MKGKLFVWMLLALLAVPGAAQWREDGKPVGDTEWRKGWGKYGALLHLTDKPDELFAAWEKPGTAVPVKVIEVAKRGTPIVGVVFFSGCAVNKLGLCDADAVFRVFKPDGTPYSKEQEGELWAGKPPPPEGQLQLSVGAIGVRIEPQDPDGVYTVRAHLRDKISHAEVELVRTFRVGDDDVEH